MITVRHFAPLARPAGLVLTSVALVAVLFQLTGFSFVDVAVGIWLGAVGAPGSLAATVRWATPLIIIGIGAAIALRAGFFNVGAQGQYYVGATTALIVTLSFENAAPWLVVGAALVLATVAGAVFALIPGYLRVRFGTDEVITTLMFNFIAGFWLLYLTGGPFADASGASVATVSRVINPAYRLSSSSGVSPITLAVLAIVVVFAWLLTTRTRFGFTSALVGRNPAMAQWQGIAVDRVGLTAFAISGGLAGLAGWLELVGPAGRLVSGLTPEVGFTAILVAIVGGLDVRGVVAAGLLFGGLQAALFYLPIVSELPRSALDVLRGTLALLITVTAFPLGLLRRRRGSTGQSAPAAADA